jgi:LuxR family transcriptional regulator, maltose regulon positive regulatory protein
MSMVHESRLQGADDRLRRLRPPRLDRGQLTRPRLIAVLSGRFDRRATVIVAGPGFGKSTLLAQAIEENAIAPLGSDCWLSCTAADNNAATFVAAVFAATGLEALASGPPTTVDDLVGSLARLAPGTCLVLDDAHELTADSDGQRALQQLVLSLPAQCSVMISTRTMPDVPFASWMAKGEVAVLSEDHLRFTDSELSQLATSRTTDPQGLSTRTSGGWPALVELELAAGRVGGDAFLREAVLNSASANDQILLATLDAIGGGDRPLLAAAADQPIDAETWQRVQRFPMLQPVEGDGFRPHSLWQRALTDILSEADRRSARQRAAIELRHRGRADDAFQLFATVGDTDGCLAVVADACSTGCTQIGPTTIRRWHDALPEDVADSPEARLLRGLLARDQHTFASQTLELLIQAAEGFRTRSMIGPEVATLAELGFVAREQGSDLHFNAVVARLLELAGEGRVEVGALLHLGTAIFAEAVSDYNAMFNELQHIQESHVSRQLWTRLEWLRGHCQLMLGFPERGQPFTQRSLELAEDDFLGGRFLSAYMDWWCDPTARAINALPHIESEANRTPFDEVFGGGVLSTVHAYCGHIEAARAGMHVATNAGDSTFREQLRPEYRGVLAALQASIDVAEGRDSQAAEVLRFFVESCGAESPEVSRVARRFPALVHVLLPELRGMIDAANYGPSLHRARQAAHWCELLASDNPSDIARAQRIDANSLAPLANVLPLRWAISSLCRFATFDPDTSASLAEDLVSRCGASVRADLRGEIERAEQRGDARAADGARKLLSLVRVAPTAPLQINLLGPLEVVHGVALDQATRGIVESELRRQRVRQMIATLAVERTVRRDDLASWLWPEVDSRKSSQNLRTTLTYANRVLEPDRGPGDAAFVLRATPDQITLVGAPWVRTDIAQFREHLLNADDARSAGMHSVELHHLEAAVGLVRGLPLQDLAYSEWAQPVVREFNGSIALASRRLAALCFAQRRYRDASRHASLCLMIEPFDEIAHRFAVSSALGDGRLNAAHQALTVWANRMEELGVVSADLEMMRRRLQAQQLVHG